MLYNTLGIPISIGVIFLIGIFFFFNIKPKHILPAKYFHPQRFLIFKIINVVLILSIILLPLDLQLITNKKIISEKILPVQIVFDVSLSMAADDIQPSRFTSAKQSVSNLIQELEGYSISLITFSGIPFIYTPFSTDTPAILDKWEKTNLGDFPPTEEFVGTAIGDALLLAVSNLSKVKLADDNYPGVIVLITDGDSNKGYDPQEVMGLLQKKKVPVFTLGLGAPDYLIGFDKRSTPVKTSINIPLLQDISKQTGGEFFRILQESNFDEFVEHLKTLIKGQEKQTIENHYLVVNQYVFAIIILCLLFLGYVQIKNIRH